MTPASVFTAKFVAQIFFKRSVHVLHITLNWLFKQFALIHSTQLVSLCVNRSKETPMSFDTYIVITNWVWCVGIELIFEECSLENVQFNLQQSHRKVNEFNLNKKMY